MEASAVILFKLFISLASVLNPLGALPVYLTLTQENSRDEIKRIATSCSIAVFITIAVSLIFGQKILGFFGISVASFRVGGGVLLATMALSMLQAKRTSTKLNKQEERESSIDIKEIGIVPLAIPLLAGPGTISTSIIQAQSLQTPMLWAGAIMVCLLIGITVKLVLTFSRLIGRRLGTVGVNVMTRIMGLILMAMAVEFITGGLKEIFPAL